MRPCAPLGMALLLGGLPFAADWGDDGSLCLEFLHSLIHFLAVEAGKLCDFACGKRCASLPHGLQYCVFCCHNDSLFVFVLYVDECVSCRFVYGGTHVPLLAPSLGGQPFSPPGACCGAKLRIKFGIPAAGPLFFHPFCFVCLLVHSINPFHSLKKRL